MATTLSTSIRGALLSVLVGASGCGEDSDGCGAYEVESADGCECVDGYTRQESSGYCIATGLTLPQSQLPKHTGVDTPCSSDADCQGLDASFCETEVSGTCLVPRCDTSDPKACSAGHHCCAFGGLPNLCVSAELSGGVCR